MEFLRGLCRPERLDSWGFEQLCEDVGMWTGSCVGNYVGDESRRCGTVGVGEVDGGLKGLESPGVYLIHDGSDVLSEGTLEGRGR